MEKGTLIHQWGDHRLVALADGEYQLEERTTDALGNDCWNDCFLKIGMAKYHLALSKGIVDAKKKSDIIVGNAARMDDRGT